MTSFPNEYEHDAVEVKVDCRIKIDRQGYNTTYRDMIPEQFIHTSTNGERYTKLKKGEHGWRTRVSLDGNFSVCNFQRGERVLTYIVETKNLSVGVKKKNLHSLAPQVHISSSDTVTASGASSLEKFIRTFWAQARAQRGVLSTFGLSPARRDRLFGDGHFQNNVDRIINALSPGVNTLLSNATVYDLARNMIRELPAITINEPEHKICYVRLYTNEDEYGNPCNPAVYGGTCEKPGTRHANHQSSTESSSKRHYQIARQYPRGRRMMFEMFRIDGFDATLTAMTEETVTAIFSTYVGWHFAERDDDADQAWVLESSRAKAMFEIRKVAALQSGFLHLKWEGCNVSVPLFHQETAGCTWARQTIPATPYQPKMHRYTTGFTFKTIYTDAGNRHQARSAQLWIAPHIDWKFNEKTIATGNLQTGQVCSLVFEVTDDKSRHPDPYLVVPDVGLYEHYDEVSSMAVFIIAYYQDSNTWKKTGIYHQRPLNRMEGIGPNSQGEPHRVPEGYIQVKRILQMLEGIQWESTNQDFPFNAYSVAAMNYAVYNHLQQTVKMVEIAHPQVTRPLPKLMSFEENSDLMFQKYPHLIVGPSERPGLDVLLPDTPMTNRRANTEKCDFCFVATMRSNSFAQCRESTIQCQVCRLYLNRPCTWSDRPRVKQWQETGDPLHLFYGPVKEPICEDVLAPSGANLLIESLDERPEEG